MAIVLLQGSDDRAGPVSRARHFHPDDEAEEYASVDAWRGPHNPPRARVLRLANASLGNRRDAFYRQAARGGTAPARARGYGSAPECRYKAAGRRRGPGGRPQRSGPGP